MACGTKTTTCNSKPYPKPAVTMIRTQRHVLMDSSSKIIRPHARIPISQERDPMKGIKTLLARRYEVPTQKDELPVPFRSFEMFYI